MTDLSGKKAAAPMAMVDVGGKPVQRRFAEASGRIGLSKATLARIRSGTIPKGDVLTTARLAGIMAAKATPDIIPLCHPLPLNFVDVTARLDTKGIVVTAAVKATAQTGVEMEALTAVSVALLTVYDMCKAVDKAMVFGDIRLLRKTKQ